MIKICIALYIAAAVTTALMFYRLDIERDTVRIPAFYVGIGAVWPSVGLALIEVAMAGEMPGSGEK